MGDEKERREPSFGNIGDQHWSRARRGMNQEALDYYRERSKAPGVEGGGGSRNFYCMQCDGVIAFDRELATCPHCGAPIDEKVKRYFNWVEINEPNDSDARALLRLALPYLIALVVIAVALALWRPWA
jgi:hypothetical protein